MSDTVWVVCYGDKDGGPGPASAVYDNEAAALKHVEFQNQLLLEGHSDRMTWYEAWAVQSEPVMADD